MDIPHICHFLYVIYCFATKQRNSILGVLAVLFGLLGVLFGVLGVHYIGMVYLLHEIEHSELGLV